MFPLPKKSIEELMPLAEALTGSYVRSYSLEKIRNRLYEFLEGYRPIGLDLEPIEWFRVRPCYDDHGSKNVSNVLYPPNGCPSFGRAQLPGTKVLYASGSEHVAFDEAGAQLGDKFELVDLRPAPESKKISAHCLGLFESFHMTSTCPNGTRAIEEELRIFKREAPAGFLSAAFIDSVITSLFRQPCKRPFEYKLTALYSEMHLQNAAVMYPSVEGNGGVNIAVPAHLFDEYFEVCGVRLIEITGSFHHSFYSYALLKHTTSISNSGELNWADASQSDRPRNAKWRKNNY